MAKQPHTPTGEMTEVNFIILNTAAAHERALEGWREMGSELAQKTTALLVQVTSSTWLLEELLLYFLFPFLEEQGYLPVTVLSSIFAGIFWNLCDHLHYQ